MNIKTYINLKAYDKEGILYLEKEQEANSLVRAFIAFLLLHISQASETIADIAGTSRAANAYAANCSTVAAAGLATRGIVAGTGTTAVAYTQYALVTPVVHGTGAGQLSYGVQTFDANCTDTGSAYKFQMARAIANNSGGDINIKEVAIYAQWYTSYTIMIDRTLLDHNIVDGTSISLTYKFEIT